jgi:fermentation-respiration switch protein FrsA (DUF1100 family)
MGAGRRRIVIGLVATATAVTTLLPTAASAGAATTASPVGVTKVELVDRSRPTAANAACPELPSRTLPTTIYYPAEAGTPTDAAHADAPPDRAHGPYPLVVFAHGFGATSETYAPLLAHWAAAGYVVAAPTFPLSSATSPCGAIAGDVVNQPQDMSFVITSVLRQAHTDGALLSGVVDEHHIGAAGHSNGGITVYGLVGNTKLRDDRVDAALILSGTAQRYPTGKYDLAHLPPVLFVHGTDDALVPYKAAIDGFNAARGPKALFSITGGDHGSAATPNAYAATTDFLDAYLRGDAAAKARLPGDATPGTSTMKFVAKKGATVTVPTVTTPKLDLKASVSPHKDLHGGQVVTVTWSGYTPGKVVNVLQCNGTNRDLSKSSECDYSKAKLLQPDPTGAGSLQLEITAGPIGTGSCDADHQGCFVIVNNASSTDPKDSVQVDITFAR